MAQNLMLNPMTRDYVMKNGSPIPSDRVLEASFIALSIQQGQWLYGVANQGSLLYTLEKLKRDSSIEQRFAGYANDANIRQLINTGQALGVQTTNISTSKNGSLNQISLIPNTTQLSNQLNFVSV